MCGYYVANFDLNSKWKRLICEAKFAKQNKRQTGTCAHVVWNVRWCGSNVYISGMRAAFWLACYNVILICGACTCRRRTTLAPLCEKITSLTSICGILIPMTYMKVRCIWNCKKLQIWTETLQYYRISLLAPCDKISKSKQKPERG